jgi:tetratricopeptide (TPR) repeat protein
VVIALRVGRNDPCPCGSGKKYKKCCMPNDEAKIADAQSSESDAIHSEPEEHKKNPRSDEIENNMKRASNLMEEGKYEQSARAFRSIVLTDKDNYRALTGLGRCLIEMGMSEDACKCFERALEINPDYTQAKINLAFHSKDN